MVSMIQGQEVATACGKNAGRLHVAAGREAGLGARARVRKHQLLAPPPHGLLASGQAGKSGCFKRCRRRDGEVWALARKRTNAGAP